MEIKSLGHVVLRVSNLERSEAFYRDVLGLPVCAHYQQNGLNMAFFSLGDHHDFAIAEGEVGGRELSGLHHVAFKIGSNLDELKAARDKLEAQGIGTDPVDHTVTKSIYISDPDGNGIELYVDVSEAWREDPSVIAYAEPMEL